MPEVNPSHPEREGKMPNTSSLLGGVDVFEGLGPKDLALLFEKAELRTYPAGSIVFSPEDSSCEWMYLLKEGRVERYRLTATGKHLVTKRILPGSVFGIMGLFGRSMQGNFSEAIEDSSIYVVTREQVLALLNRQPDLTLRLLALMINRLRLLEERLVVAVYSPVSVRLAYFLLTAADPVSGVLSDITHDEIGSTIGAVCQMVTENLSILRRQGLIITKQKRIQIVDRRRLEDIVQGSQS